LATSELAVGAQMCSIGGVIFLRTRATAFSVHKGGFVEVVVGIARVNEGGCRIQFGADALEPAAGDTFSFAVEPDWFRDNPLYMDKSLIMVPRQCLRQLGLGEELIHSRSGFIAGDCMTDIVFGHFYDVARRLHHGPSLSHRGLVSISQSVVQMTAVLLEENKPSKTGEPQLLAAAKAYVDHHLLDPGLTPASVAAALHVSLRTLYRSFTGSDHSVAEYIRDARLLAARRELAAAGNSANITLVAQRCGFAGTGYFSRLFSRRFGCLPSEYIKNL
jgi:AraC-like DNA-binding protein